MKKIALLAMTIVLATLLAGCAEAGPTLIISDISASDITETSAVITWTTNEDSRGVVDYGTTSSYGSTASDQNLRTSHSVTISGLTPGTTCHYRVTSQDAYGHEAVSGDYSFITASASEPFIVFGPECFNFAATEGGANPEDQTLEIWNSGSGTLNWSVSDNANWLTLNPTNGTSIGEHDAVTLSVDISGLAAGTYDATITISASGATNTPQTTPCVLLTIGSPTTVTTIAYSPLSFSFSATEGGANPEDQTLEIWNSGSGILNWSVSDDADWLTLNPTNGTSTGEHDAVTLSVDISGLAAETYNAIITISASGATNTPQTVSVSLTIGSPTAIAYSPLSFSFSATERGANPEDQTLEIWNSGSGTLNWSVSDDADWLTLNPTNGTSTGEHDAVTLSVDISGLAAETYNAIITISASGATNTPQTVSVSLTVNEEW
jgi:hypothetical protein